MTKDKVASAAAVDRRSGCGQAVRCRGEVAVTRRRRGRRRGHSRLHLRLQARFDHVERRDCMRTPTRAGMRSKGQQTADKGGQEKQRDTRTEVESRETQEGRRAERHKEGGGEGTLAVRAQGRFHGQRQFVALPVLSSGRVRLSRIEALCATTLSGRALLYSALRESCGTVLSSTALSAFSHKALSAPALSPIELSALPYSSRSLCSALS